MKAGEHQLLIKKLSTLLFLGITALLLSSCSADLNGHTVKITPTTNSLIKIATYNNDGQKVDQIKTNKVKIKDDDKLDPAIDLNYGQNKIIHTSSTMIAYEGIHNYMDDYRHLQAQKQTQDPFADKSIPFMVHLYTNFKKQFDNQSKNVIIVKTQDGTPIAAFTGNQIKIKQIGTSDFPNSLITIDGHHLFVYDCSYTTYPISALKAMSENQKASSQKKQQAVKTQQASPIDSSKK